MIKLILTAEEADLLQRLLKDETARLVAEDALYREAELDSTPGLTFDLVREAIDHERERVVNLRTELLDAILCTLPDLS